MAINEKGLEQLRSAIEFAKQSIGFAFLLNGGALIALLTFLGSALDTMESTFISHIVRQAIYFVFGLTLAALTSVVAYIAQLNYFKQDSGMQQNFTPPTNLRILLIVGILGSIALFAIGAVRCLNALAS